MGKSVTFPPGLSCLSCKPQGAVAQVLGASPSKNWPLRFVTTGAHISAQYPLGLPELVQFLPLERELPEDKCWVLATQALHGH